MNHEPIYAVDFDGTLCEYAWPDIGKPYTEMIEYCKFVRGCGVKLILWTCREGEKLKEAVEWCKQQGLEFDAVNENLPEVIEEFGKDARKIFATRYIDDRAVNPEDIL